MKMFAKSYTLRLSVTASNVCPAVTDETIGGAQSLNLRTPIVFGHIEL